MAFNHSSSDALQDPVAGVNVPHRRLKDSISPPSKNSHVQVSEGARINERHRTQSGARRPRTLGFESLGDLLTASNIKAEGHGGGGDLVFKHLLILPLF